MSLPAVAGPLTAFCSDLRVPRSLASLRHVAPEAEGQHEQGYNRYIGSGGVVIRRAAVVVLAGVCISD